MWRSAPPPSHAAKHVRIELDRGSYSGTGVKKPKKMARKPLDTWCLPDSGAQVTLLNPRLVKALGGNDLIQKANLQIKDAGNHLLAMTGCVFVVIFKKNEKSGVVTKTH